MAASNTWSRRAVVPGRVYAVNNQHSSLRRPIVADLYAQTNGCNGSESMKSVKLKQSSSAEPIINSEVEFASFQASTSDVWSLDEDSDVISAKTAQSAANAVLQRHSGSALSPNKSGGKPVIHNSTARAKTQGMQLLAIQSKGDNALPSCVEPIGVAPHLLHHSPVSNAKTASDHTGSRNLYPKLPNLTGPETTGAVAVSRTPIGSGSSVQSTSAQSSQTVEGKYNRILQLLCEPNIDIKTLRDVCWRGIPHKLRPRSWRILSGYMPTDSQRQQEALKRKRLEYFNFVEQYFHTRFDSDQQDTFRQIHIDIPRMCPIIPLFQQKAVQEMFERILFIFAIRHPASGYVQGINDLVTPFFVVFLSEFIKEDVEVGLVNVQELPRDQLEIVEADSFWCFTRLLETIQDNYTFAQPGVQTKILNLSMLMSRVESKLHQHLERNHVEYLQFTFRWMNNLLMREIPLRCTIRLWDTYLAENNGFASFHVYVCAAFLRMWSSNILQQKDFQNIMVFLQNLPTSNWDDPQISELTADAFGLMCLFEGTKKHLTLSNSQSNSGL